MCNFSILFVLLSKVYSNVSAGLLFTSVVKQVNAAAVCYPQDKGFT